MKLQRANLAVSLITYTQIHQYMRLWQSCLPGTYAVCIWNLWTHIIMCSLALAEDRRRGVEERAQRINRQKILYWNEIVLILLDRLIKFNEYLLKVSGNGWCKQPQMFCEQCDRIWTANGSWNFWLLVIFNTHLPLPFFDSILNGCQNIHIFDYLSPFPPHSLALALAVCTYCLFMAFLIYYTLSKLFAPISEISQRIHFLSRAHDYYEYICYVVVIFFGLIFVCLLLCLHC